MTVIPFKIITLTPILLITLTLLAVFVLLLVKGGPVVRWIFSALLLLVVIGFFGLFFVHVTQPVTYYDSQPDSYAIRHEVADQPMSGTPNAINIEGGSSADPESPNIVSPGSAVVDVIADETVWRKGLEEELVPDIYSSTVTAAYGLGIQLQETIASLPQQPDNIVIVEKDDDIDFMLLEQLRRGLKAILPEIDIVISSEVSEGHVWISLQLKGIESRQIKTSEIQKGTVIQMSQNLHGGSRGILQAIIHTSDNKYADQVEFDHCLWLYDTEKFRSVTAGYQWAVIASTETAISKEQALQEVIERARDYLARQIQAQGITAAFVQENDLRDYGFIVDEYSQRLQGLSGSIWRAAVLLDISPERLQILQRDTSVVTKQVKRSWFYRVFSLAGMILLITALSMLINALTKGYYSVVITIIAIGIIVLFVLLIMLV